MARPDDAIGPVLDVHEARGRRSAEHWAGDGSVLRGVPLDVVQRAVGDAARELGRDLTADEVARVCSAAVSAHLHAEEQRAAEEAIAGAREEERLAYLRRRALEYRATSDERTSGPRPKMPPATLGDLPSARNLRGRP